MKEQTRAAYVPGDLPEDSEKLGVSRQIYTNPSFTKLLT